MIKHDENTDQKPIKYQSKIDRTSIENQSTIDRKSFENQSKIGQKSIENRSKIDPKSIKNRSQRRFGSENSPIAHLNRHQSNYLAPFWSKKSPQDRPNASQNGPQIGVKFNKKSIKKSTSILIDF